MSVPYMSRYASVYLNEKINEYVCLSMKKMKIEGIPRFPWKFPLFIEAPD